MLPVVLRSLGISFQPVLRLFAVNRQVVDEIIVGMRSQTGLPMGSQLGPQEYRDIRPGVFGQQRDKFLAGRIWPPRGEHRCSALPFRSEEHTSELQSLMRISYAVLCLKKKKYQ